MKVFLEPRCVAIVGISRRSGPGSFNLMENMINFGYEGEIYPVNPNAEEVLGKRAYPSVSSIGREMDLAIIVTPREAVMEVLKDCARTGVCGAIVVSQGFADADDVGRALQEEMAALARDSGMRILGPNTLGVVNHFGRFTTSFMPFEEECAPVGLVCQSGVFFAGSRSLVGPIGKGVDLGNACDIGFEECLEAFADDPQIKIIALHVEGVRDGRRFMKAAAVAAGRKPVVVLKAGRDESASVAAASHTGSMAGDFRLFQAALGQAGVLMIEGTQWMKDAIRALLFLPPMRGDRVAVITFTGGGAIMALDLLEERGLKLARLSKVSLEPIAKLSPSWLPLGNPVDIWPAIMRHGAQKVYATALRSVLMDPQVDAILCISIAPRIPEDSFLDASKALNEVLMEDGVPAKPVVAWLYGPNIEEIQRSMEVNRRMMVFHSLERAVWALSLRRHFSLQYLCNGQDPI
jgi:acetyltransferase